MAPSTTAPFELLIVEADTASRRALIDCLEGRPFVIAACGSMAEAEALIGARRFDAVAVGKWAERPRSLGCASSPRESP